MRLTNVVASLFLSGLSLFAITGSGCGGDESGTTTTTGGNNVTCALPAACTAPIKECVGLVDNKGQAAFGLRMTQILISKPTTLAPSSFTGGVVSNGVAWNDPACYLGGQGTFSWILYFDSASKTVCTGGAKPVTNPADGYTFVNETIMQGGQAFDIKPIKVMTDFSTGTFASTTGQDITVPIYTAEGSVVLLPLKGAKILDGKLSADNNCVGSFNASGLDPLANCLPLPAENQYSFVNAGKIEGYITLEGADSVVVDLAKATLCALLTGSDDGGTPTKKCKRDAMGKIEVKGDWCDATNAAADATCADSVQLSAEFAASSVKVNGGCPL